MAKLSLFALISISLAVASYSLPSSRVVGGVDATEGQFPHQISLRRNGSHNCGGSIISRNFVLTAAHCVGTQNSEGVYETYPLETHSIRAGSNDRFTGGVLKKVSEVIVHENYGDFLNDVALLRVEEPFIFSANIQPIALASKDTPPETDVIISGWGRITHGGDIPQKLQWNTLKAISREECNEKIKWDSPALICLDHAANNGACNGDSGGPAMVDNEVVGIAGFVYGGCGNVYPDGYAKVYYHAAWIRKHSDV